MPRPFVHLPAILALAFLAVEANAAEKSQYSCSSGGIVRRVIIEVGDLSSGLPCEVVYWKDNEAPGVRRVLWNARSDAAFCQSKAAGLVDKLISSGWLCEPSGEAAPTTAIAPAAVQPPTSPASSEPVTTVPAVDAATVANAPPIEPADKPLQAAPSTVVTPTVPATTSKPPAAASETPSTQTAAVVPATPAPPAAADQLESVISENLNSLNKSVDGDFRAQIGQFGDLNNDGIEDAVVFFNYESSATEFTQFVAAYLYNGESYHLAATKPVGGTDRAVQRVEIESIVDGSILLKLQLNDASQTENRRAAMVLKDGQLVETQ